MAIRKGFKFERFREICKQIGDLHGELTQIMADSDKATIAAAQDDKFGVGEIKNSLSKPAVDQSHGQDDSLVNVVRAAIRAEKEAPVSMDYLLRR